VRISPIDSRWQDTNNACGTMKNKASERARRLVVASLTYAETSPSDLAALHVYAEAVIAQTKQSLSKA